MSKFNIRLTLATMAFAGVFGVGVSQAADGPIKIGAINLLSGGAATYGKFAQQGAQLALEEINNSGGVLGRTLEVKFEDSEGKAATAIQAARKLVFQDGVVGIMGLDSSGVAQGLVPVMPELEVPLIITHAATPDVTGVLCNKYTYRVSVNVNQNMMGAAMVAADLQAKKWTTIGPDYAFGHQSWEFFSQYLKELNPDVELSKNPSYPRFGAEDFTPFIDTVMNAKPDGVLVSLWGGDLVNFIRQANNKGFFEQDFKVLLTVGAATEVLVAMGDKMPENVWAGTRYWFDSNNTELNKQFVSKYQEEFGTPPSYNAEGIYVAMYAFKQAIEKAGKADGNAITEALKGLTLNAPTGPLKLREGDNQALIGPTWGLLGPVDSTLKIRTLTNVRNFDGEKITPAVDPECKL